MDGFGSFMKPDKGDGSERRSRPLFIQKEKIMVTTEMVHSEKTEEGAARALMQAFREIMGAEADGVVFAPGRVNLIGEHIDYNGGHVFPCALTLGTYGAFRKRTDRRMRFYSMNFAKKGIIESSLDTYEIEARDDWTRYTKGVVWAFAEKGFKAETGFDFVCCGTIPNKSGLSSSASVEVCMGTALMEMFGFEGVDQVLNAQLGQMAENVFVGLNCGIMDQFASANGKKDHAILLDCTSLKYRLIPLDLGSAKLVIINTNKPHELTESAYNDRRAECEKALELLRTRMPGLTALCELSPEEFEEVSDVLRGTGKPAEEGGVNMRKVYDRAKHAVYEESRTRAGAGALSRGDLSSFGKFMNASHISLRDLFEVSCRELDLLAETAWQTEGVIGARMTGGGFGGCTVNIVEGGAVESFIESVGRKYRETIGYDASFYVVTAGEGAHRIV